MEARILSDGGNEGGRMYIVTGTEFWRTKTSCERADRIHKQLCELGWSTTSVGEYAEGTQLPILFSMSIVAPNFFGLELLREVPQPFNFTPLSVPLHAIVDTRPFLMDLPYANVLYVVDASPLRSSDFKQGYRELIERATYSYMPEVVRQAILESLR